jgi:hypothetical protein
MMDRRRAFWATLLCLLTALSALARAEVATIILGRDPEPPYCVQAPGGLVQSFWMVEHQTTPVRVEYFLQDPSRTINLEHQTYPGNTGLTISRSFIVPVGCADGKYWIRVEYWSVEGGNEANAEVTFYVCSQTGNICVTKLADANCNGWLEPDTDTPVQGWRICLTTPFGDQICRATSSDGRTCLFGIPLGEYVIEEPPVSGWEAIGPTTFHSTLQSGVLANVTFLNRSRAVCYHACCLPDEPCAVLLRTDCEAREGTWQQYQGSCDPNPCPGTCCDPATGECAMSLQMHCPLLKTWHGDWLSCTPSPCSPQLSMCCFEATGACALTYQSDCQVPNTWHWIPGTTSCTPNPCETDSAVDPTEAAGPVGLAVFPNPSAGAATLTFRLPEAGHANLEVFDASGRSVRVVFDGPQPRGVHAAEWDGNSEAGVSVPAGVYFVRLSTAHGRVSTPVIVVN